MKRITAYAVKLLLLAAFSHNVYSDQTQQTADYFNNIRNDPVQLRMFLQKMPKGGDLHSHLDGAVYAEKLLRFPASADLCLERDTYKVYNNDCQQQNRLQQALKRPPLYDQVIDQWSMRHFPINVKSGQKHFFDSFVKIYSAVNANTANIVRSVTNRAGRQNEQYLELMIGYSQLADNDSTAQTPYNIGRQVAERQSLEKWRDNLLKNGIKAVAARLNGSVEHVAEKVRTKQHCGTDNAQPGCSVTVRYQYFINRNLPLEEFYAQLVTGFELASQNEQVVGINIVGPENWPSALKNYDRQMQMIGYLHSRYPDVHIALHAGELKLGQVPPKYLQDHVHKAVKIAHAERIGHGVDIAYENNPENLMAYMRNRGIDVETNLTSNRQVLGLTSHHHPWPLYRRAGVPTTISTDDAGIERIDLTHEYQKAVEQYGLGYRALKDLARNSLTYSFLSGQSLWLDNDDSQVVEPCRGQTLGADEISRSCEAFLARSKKAREQWRLEKAFQNFETLYATHQ